MLWSGSPTANRLRRSPASMLDQRILRDVGVLEFVHQDVMVAALVRFQHVGVVAEQPHGVHQQVVEVARVAVAQQLVVARVDAAHDFFVL